MRAYYNEIDPAAAHILRAMIDNGVIAPGDVDTRSIKDVQANDLAGYTQAHFFAGGGLWSVAARLAGWPDDAPLWTGSCPCQPFSAAGKGLGTDDPRHLWPDFHRLIRACRPPVVMGEQVAGKAGRNWFHGVRADLAGSAYAGRAVDFPACSVDAPHQRNRLYWIAVEHAARLGWGEGRPEHEFRSGRPASAGADARGALDNSFGARLEGHTGHGDGSGRAQARRSVAAADGTECGDVADREGEWRGPGPGDTRNRQEPANIHGASISSDANGRRCDWQGISEGQKWERGIVTTRSSQRNRTFWSDADWIECHDGKARRAQSGIRDVAYGLSGRMDQDGFAGGQDIQEIPRGFLVQGMIGRVDLWRVAGNAIVPEAAAEVISAFMETYGVPYKAERAKAWRQANADRVKEYRAANRERRYAQTRAWNEANRERKNELHREWSHRNPEKVREKFAAWHAENGDRARNQQKRYRAANPGKMNALSAKKRAAKRQATPSWLTDKHKRQIEAFYALARRLSVETGIEHHVDHIEPLAGEDACGLHVPWNLQILTATANIKKGNKRVPEAAAEVIAAFMDVYGIPAPSHRNQERELERGAA